MIWILRNNQTKHSLCFPVFMYTGALPNQTIYKKKRTIGQGNIVTPQKNCLVNKKPFVPLEITSTHICHHVFSLCNKCFTFYVETINFLPRRTKDTPIQENKWLSWSQDFPYIVCKVVNPKKWSMVDYRHFWQTWEIHEFKKRIVRESSGISNLQTGSCYDIFFLRIKFV